MTIQTYPRLLLPFLLASLLMQCSSSGEPLVSSAAENNRLLIPADVNTAPVSEINRLLQMAAAASSPLAEQLFIQATELALADGNIDTAAAIVGGLGDDSAWPMAVRTRAALLRA
jgi:hypothetical protein